MKHLSHFIEKLAAPRASAVAKAIKLRKLKDVARPASTRTAEQLARIKTLSTQNSAAAMRRGDLHNSNKNLDILRSI